MSFSEHASNVTALSYTIDPRKADAGYKPFPSFKEWEKNSVLDVSKWNRYTAELEGRKNVSPNVLREAKEIVELATAIDTGAIEGLYEADRGFTFTVAAQSAIWQAVVEEEKGQKVRSLIESQLKAYEYVLDLATQQVPIAEAWIRRLHEVICESQDTYTAYTELGIQELPLPKGEYKNLPNHIIRKDGAVHSHAPVDLTPAEMHRFISELRGEAFTLAHPVLQASYAHYAFVVIHPFADGNGRIARALASIFTYRACSIPLLILVENRRDYLSALELSDKGNFQPFIDFVLERGLDSIRLFSESIRAANVRPAENTLAEIKGLYVTKGGYSHTDVDEAGYTLIELLHQEYLKYQSKLPIENLVSFRVRILQAQQEVLNPAYRLPMTKGSKTLIVSLSTTPPAHASVSREFSLEVPRDCGKDDDIIIRDIQTNELFEARMAELVPNASAVLQMRVSIAVQRTIRELTEELREKAEQSLRRTY